MPVNLPAPQWPAALVEQGPPEDPAILLGGAAVIGQAPHRILAMRINPRTLSVDYRPDVDPDAYGDYQLEEMLDELTFMDDIDKSVLVPMGGGAYVLWMMPDSDAGAR
ncbi:hypothetical protein [Rhodopila globiformis]|uniref:Uncharacterized protein n=1 Tax=Rhodopila globiformis TaxID=1071 RepID=A0A2S6N247_RHOGL|nr:hypothetical protein [Rhodopila globiformis]PPQ28679.1 hypothetical protein CCS01_23570 [Rhodopila globiformis]